MTALNSREILAHWKHVTTLGWAYGWIYHRIQWQMTVGLGLTWMKPRELGCFACGTQNEARHKMLLTEFMLASTEKSKCSDHGGYYWEHPRTGGWCVAWGGSPGAVGKPATMWQWKKVQNCIHRFIHPKCLGVVRHSLSTSKTAMWWHHVTNLKH